MINADRYSVFVQDNRAEDSMRCVGWSNTSSLAAAFHAVGLLAGEHWRSEAERHIAVVDWLRENMPRALELCPFKAPASEVSPRECPACTPDGQCVGDYTCQGSNVEATPSLAPAEVVNPSVTRRSQSGWDVNDGQPDASADVSAQDDSPFADPPMEEIQKGLNPLRRQKEEE